MLCARGDWRSHQTQADSEPDAQIEADAHEADEEPPAKGGSLSWLMSRVSFVARHIIVHRPSLTAMPTSSVSASFSRVLFR